MRLCPGGCRGEIATDQLACADCLPLLPIDLIGLAVATRSTVPEVYETVLRCAEMWFQIRRPTIERAA